MDKPNAFLVLTGFLIIVASVLSVFSSDLYSESQDIYQKVLLADSTFGTANSEMSRFLLEYQMFNDTRAYENYRDHKENYTEKIDNNETIDEGIIGRLEESKGKFNDARLLSAIQLFVLAAAFFFSIFGYSQKRVV